VALRLILVAQGGALLAWVVGSLRIPSLALGIGAQSVMVIDENGKVESFK
jgi:hypothetical protein